MSNQQENLSNMRCLDLYLESISQEEYQETQRLINPLEITTAPLNSMDICFSDLTLKPLKTQKQEDLKALRQFNIKYQWEYDLNSLLEQNYDAIILTNSNQVIDWVSNGFFEMTGYSPKYAIGKSPQFLQGPNTDARIKTKIQDSLKKKQAFKETIVNYRKNNEEYTCEITVIPMLDRDNKLTHFLALETEIDVEHSSHVLA